MLTMSHRNQLMNPGQEMLDDNIEYTTERRFSVAYEIRPSHPHPRTIFHRRRRLLNEMLRPVSSQARRLNYGQDGRILMLPRANKTRTNEEA